LHFHPIINLGLYCAPLPGAAAGEYTLPALAVGVVARIHRPDQHRLPKPTRPGRFQVGYLPVDRAVVVVRTRRVTAAHQELAYDLTAREEKVPFQNLNAITSRKASYFQRKSFSNKQVEIILNTNMCIFRMRIAIVTICGHVDILLSSSE